MKGQDVGRNKRLLWLDLIKGVSMFFIIMSHAHPYAVYARFYTPFYLCAFFFSSGFTFSKRSSFKDFALHKAHTMIVPYFCLGVINAVLAHFADGDDLAERFLGLLLSRNRINDDLWFVVCLFTMQFLFYFINSLSGRMLRKQKGSEDLLLMVLSLLIMTAGYVYIRLLGTALPLQFETACVMLPWMSLGFLFKVHQFGQYRGKSWFLLGCFLIYVILISLVDNPINIHKEEYGIFPLFLVQALFGTVMITFLCMVVEDTVSPQWLRPIMFVGRNTFVYYAFQSKVIRAFDVVSAKLPITFSNAVLSPLYALLACFVLAIPATVIDGFHSLWDVGSPLPEMANELRM